jgi:hypothetical protein
MTEGESDDDLLFGDGDDDTLSAKEGADSFSCDPGIDTITVMQLSATLKPQIVRTFGIEYSSNLILLSLPFFHIVITLCILCLSTFVSLVDMIGILFI